MFRISFPLSLLVTMLLACAGTGSIPEDPDIASGRSFIQRAQYDSAQAVLENALRRGYETNDMFLRALAQKWMGSMFLAYGRGSDALQWYRRSLSLLDSLGGSGDAGAVELEQRNVRSNMAVAQERLTAYGEAEELYLGVIELDRAAGDDNRLSITLSNLGMLYDRQAVEREFSEDSSGAFALHAKAKAQFLASLDRMKSGDGWTNLGNNHVHAGRYDSALACYSEAAAIYGREGSRAKEALVEGNRGFILKNFLGKNGEAAAAFGRSTEIFEELRGNISSIDMRASFLSNWYHLYDEQVSLLVALDRPAEAFEAAERAKARSFLDMLGSRRVGAYKTMDDATRSTVEEEESLRARIATVLTDPDSTEVFARLSRRHAEVLAELRMKNPEYAYVNSVNPVSVAELQSMLDTASAVLEYYIGEAEGYAFVIRRHSVHAVRLQEAARGDLEAEVDALRNMLYGDFPRQKMQVLREARLQRRLSPEDARREWLGTAVPSLWYWKLVEMYSRLLAPVEVNLAGLERLYIVPHGVLHQFPFAALVRPGQRGVRMDAHLQRPHYLIEDMSLAYLPSASVLPFALARNNARKRSGLVVGDPAYADARYRRMALPGALIEADTVASYLQDPLVLTRAQADEARVTREMAERDVIHFATHGELNAGHPLQSRILLAASDSCACDGSLTVEEIFNLDIHASLVALSACQTAQVAGAEGASTPGDELVGLTRSFLYAGTPAVLASLWVVDDQATLEWMRMFYRSWLVDGLPPVDAARTAAVSMLNEPGDPDWVFPYYWAAFIYFGAM